MSEDNLRTLEELLAGQEISDFAKSWIEESNINSEQMKKTYSLLISYGLTPKKIAAHAHLLIWNPATIERNAQKLRELGLSNAGIAFRADLLGRDPEIINENHQKLRELGLSNAKIAEQIQLLGNNPATINENHQKLRELGLSNERIATQAYLLGMNSATIERNYQILLALGLNASRIASRASLLGKNPATIERNAQKLRDLGLTDSTIASRADLLGRDPETIERNAQKLRELGLSDEKIATYAALLGRNPKTISMHYQKAISLLRNDYQDRNSGKRIILLHANLLGLSPQSIENNVQFLNEHNISYNLKPLLLGSKVQTKREKFAWMLRNVFDYQNVPQENKRERIADMYAFIRENPRRLVESISTLQRNLEELREKAREYIRQ